MIDSVDGGLLVVSFFSVGVVAVAGEVFEGGFVVLVVVAVATAEVGLRGGAEVTDAELRVEVLRSAAVDFRSGDLGVVPVEAALWVVEDLLIVFVPASFSAGFVEATFFTPLVVLEVVEEIGGLVGGLFNPETAP